MKQEEGNEWPKVVQLIRNQKIEDTLRIYEDDTVRTQRGGDFKEIQGKYDWDERLFTWSYGYLTRV